MTVKTVEAAKRRLKQIEAATWIFTHAIGIMEVDGWFGRGQDHDGLSKCTVPLPDGHGGTYNEDVCFNGGAVCAGIAIDFAAQRYAKPRRWNRARTQELAYRHLDLFQTLNGREPNSDRCSYMRGRRVSHR